MVEIHATGRHLFPRPMCPLCYPDPEVRKAAQAQQRELRKSEASYFDRLRDASRTAVIPGDSR